MAAIPVPVIAAWLAIASGDPIKADDPAPPRDFTVYGQQVRLGWQTPIVIVTLDTLLWSRETAWSFYLHGESWDPAASRTGFAVSQERRSGVLWTTTQSCPGLPDIISALEQLTPPSVDLVGVGPDRPPPIPPSPDTDAYRIIVHQASWHPDRRSGYLAFQGDDQSPVADLAERLQAATEGCWSEAPPATAAD